MLSTRDRRLLLDSLRPPTGYQLDSAIGCSFTLDLLALLTAPLAFTFFDWEDEDAELKADPIALLDALRRYSSKIHLFCQAGRISLPKPEQSLLAYLEDSVIEVTAPEKGALFHPKLWVLRFTGSGDEPVRYRVICSSRNLTFDRCWDTALVLEGELTDRLKAFAQNHPLADFLSELPNLALRREGPAAAAETLNLMEEELRRVRFDLPEGFSEIAFVPIGLDRLWERKAVSPLSPHSGRLLVVSPFLSDDLIAELAAENKIVALVSTPEALDSLTDAVFEQIDKAYVLSPEAELDPGDPSPESAAAVRTPFRGLHAKLYVMDNGWDSLLWTGSANGTMNGFRRNVEVLVQLTGRRKDCGIEAVLGLEESGDVRRDAFRSLLRPYSREGRQPPDLEREKLEKRLDTLSVEVARLGLRFSVRGGQGEGYSLVLQSPPRSDVVPTAATIAVWPASLQPEVMQPLPAEAAETGWSGLSFEAITSFCAVEIVLRGAAEESVSTRFVLNLPLEGAPPDRRERLLRSILKDRRQLMRLLLLLLSEEGLTPTELLDQPTAGVGEFGRWLGDNGEGLLEALLLALEQRPRRLDDVARLLEELQRTPEGRELLPEGLAEIWEPIWRARQEASS